MSSSDGKDSFILLKIIGLENARGGSALRYILCICSCLATSALKCLIALVRKLLKPQMGRNV